MPLNDSVSVISLQDPQRDLQLCALRSDCNESVIVMPKIFNYI